MTPGTIPTLRAKPTGGTTPVTPPPTGGTQTLYDVISSASLTAGLTVCMDAGASSSYDGMSQTWNNMVSGGATNFYRGASDAAGSDDPAFVGTANARDANTYFATDGADQMASTSTSWYSNLMKTINGSFSSQSIPADEYATLAIWFWVPAATYNTNCLVDAILSGGGSNYTGFMICVTSDKRIYYLCANGNTSGTSTTIYSHYVVTSNPVVENAWNCVVIRKVTGSATLDSPAVEVNLNGTVSTANRSRNAIAASTVKPVSLFRNSGIGNPGMVSGARVVALAYWNTSLDATQVETLRTSFNTARGLS